jgi:hypothetical protein
MLGDVD